MGNESALLISEVRGQWLDCWPYSNNGYTLCTQKSFFWMYNISNLQQQKATPGATPVTQEQKTKATIHTDTLKLENNNNIAWSNDS